MGAKYGLHFLFIIGFGLAIALNRLWYDDSEVRPCTIWFIPTFFLLNFSYLLSQLQSIFLGPYSDSCLFNEDNLKIMTFNIRGDNLDLHSNTNNWWKGRNKRAAATIHKYRPDVAGLQEGSKKQLRDLVDAISTGAHKEYAILGHSDRFDFVALCCLFPVLKALEIVWHEIF